MGLSIIALLMMTGTLSLREIAAQQSGCIGMFLPTTFFFIFFNLCLCRNK
jgi:NADH-quinone oxidoreductase subunit H